MSRSAAADGGITIENLSVRFKRDEEDVLAVRDVSLTFNEGQATGVVGESGSGKSVLAMAILRLLPENAAVSGHIYFAGKDLLAAAEETMRGLRGGQIGLIPQSPSESINPALKIRGQVAELFTLHRGVAKKTANRMARSLLELFRLADAERCLNGYGFQLSGGMKQRVVAAFGVGGAPSWLIADEPTKGLDRTLEGQVRETLRTVSGDAGMLLITHDLLLARSLCERIVVMHSGQVLEQGGSEILDEPLHPYTQGLMDSIPCRGMTAMPLTQASPCANLCPVVSWCPHRLELCRRAAPPLVEARSREVRCFRYA